VPDLAGPAVSRLRRLRRALVLVSAGTAMSTAMTTGAAPASASDDYPWRTASDSAADPWGFTLRQCVSWTAFKLAQRGVPLDNGAERWGDAANWDDTARRLGHGIGAEPVVGAVAHWNAGERAPQHLRGARRPNGWLVSASTGHVGYVTGVHADGSALVQQYNGDGTRSWSVVRVRAPRYLYVGVIPPA
jgi:surface antigen